MICFECVDAYDAIKKIPDASIDLVFTDPPFELDNYGGGHGEMKRNLNDLHIDFMSKGFDFSIFAEYVRVLKKVNIVLFCSTAQLGKILCYWQEKGYSVSVWHWYKRNSIPFAEKRLRKDVEYMVYVREPNVTFNDPPKNERSSIFDIPTIQGGDRWHPAEKPLKLLRKVVKILSNRGDVVLDTFAGSASIGKVCKVEGRGYIGYEIIPDFYEKAKNELFAIEGYEEPETSKHNQIVLA